MLILQREREREDHIYYKSIKLNRIARRQFGIAVEKLNYISVCISEVLSKGKSIYFLGMAFYY